MTRSLDFQSELSYKDYQTTRYGDINNDGTTSELMEELTTGTGFKPIRFFKGTFDGKNSELNNLYISGNKLILGLFEVIENAQIKNLCVNGKIVVKSEESVTCGGIVGQSINEGKLENLIFSGEIKNESPYTTRKGTGGIIGEIRKMHKTNGEFIITNCKNKSNIISSYESVGGICGIPAYNIIIMNCSNEGNLKINNAEHYITVGGIAGYIQIDDAKTEIYNCINKGKIENDSKAAYSTSGGILGNTTSNANTHIVNCWNIGNTYAKGSSGGIQGGFWYGEYKSTINNCYYDGSKSDRSVGGAKEEYATKLTTEQMQGKEKINNQDGTSSTLVELLNKEIDNNTNGIDTTKWLRWKQGEDGYPTFEEK